MDNACAKMYFLMKIKVIIGVYFVPLSTCSPRRFLKRFAWSPFTWFCRAPHGVFTWVNEKTFCERRVPLPHFRRTFWKRKKKDEAAISNAGADEKPDFLKQA